MSEVVDLRSALNQFRLIVEEGEGSSLFTLKGDLNKRSHFIKFVQIYTMCDVNISSINDNSENAIVNFDLTDGDYAMTTDENILNKWNTAKDQEVDSEIAYEFCADREDNDQAICYPDTYAKAAFTNAYQKLISECDFLFNTNIQTFKDQYLTESNVSEDEARRQFEVFRRKRM